MPKDASLLIAALAGYEQRLAEIDNRIAEIKRQLRGRSRGGADGGGVRKRRRMSAEARARIAEAQRKRWAKWRKK